MGEMTYVAALKSQGSQKSSTFCIKKVVQRPVSPDQTAYSTVDWHMPDNLTDGMLGPEDFGAQLPVSQMEI